MGPSPTGGRSLVKGQLIETITVFLFKTMKSCSILTAGVYVLTQLCLGLSVGSVTGFVGKSGRHGGGSDYRLEGAFPLLHV